MKRLHEYFRKNVIKFYRKKKYGTTFVDNVWGPKKKLKNKLNKIKFPLECGFPQIHFVVATGGLLLMKRKVEELCPFFSGSSTEVRWRTKHLLCRMDREKITKEVEHSSSIGGMRNWRITNGLVFIVVLMLLVALMLHS